MFSLFLSYTQCFGVRKGCIFGPDLLMYELILSAIPIVTPVVSYWLMILNSSIILVMLRTVNCCSSILTLFKNGSVIMSGN
jgi:hypothetical protein